MKTPLQILKDARELISVKERWCQGASAKDANGHYCDPLAKEAVRWTLGGAVERAGGMPPSEAMIEAWNLLSAESPVHPALINDWEGHEAVIGLLDHHISAQEARERG